MLGIALFLGLNWYYATKKNFIDEKVPARDITITIRTNVLFIVISLLALSLSFVLPRWSALVYLLIFPLEYMIGKM
jgi:hypothetical protein